MLIQTVLNGMLTIMLAKFMLNDVPHALFGSQSSPDSISLNPDGSWTIRDTTSYYHATPERNTRWVLEQGLKPSQAPGFTAGLTGRKPNRIYLSPHPGNLVDLLASARENEQIEAGKYVILQVILPFGTRVCWDPDDFGFFSVYVTIAIPPKNIQEIGWMELNGEYELQPPDLEDWPLEENVPRAR